MCEGRAETTRLLGDVEHVVSYLGVPCSASSRDSLVLTTRGHCWAVVSALLRPCYQSWQPALTISQGPGHETHRVVVRRVYLAVQKCQLLIF